MQTDIHSIKQCEVHLTGKFSLELSLEEGTGRAEIICIMDAHEFKG